MEEISIFYDSNITVGFQNCSDICWLEDHSVFCFSGEKDGNRFRHFIPINRVLRITIKDENGRNPL